MDLPSIETKPVPRTSLSDVADNSIRVAKKFQFLRDSKKGSDEDLEKASSLADTRNTSLKQGKTEVETTSHSLSS